MRLFILLGLIGLSFFNGCAMRSHLSTPTTPTVSVDRSEVLTLLYVIDESFYSATKDILSGYSLPKLKRLCTSYESPSRNFKQFQKACVQLISTPLAWDGDYKRTNRMLTIIADAMARMNSNFVGAYIRPSEGRPAVSEECKIEGYRYYTKSAWHFHYTTDGWCSTEDKEALKKRLAAERRKKVMDQMKNAQKNLVIFNQYIRK